MKRYSKYERFAAPLNSEEVQKKLDEIIAQGKEIVHYEEKKQETNRFYITMILGTLVVPEGEKQQLNG